MADIPSGWKLVPVEATDNMLRAIRRQRTGARVGKGDRADWAAWLSAVPQLVGAAEVPMPEVHGWIGWILHNGEAGRHPMFSTYEPTAYESRDRVVALSDVRTYGDAREAAGYAAGVAASGKDAERYRWLRERRRTGELDTHGIYIGVDSPRFVGKWAISEDEADSEIDAALRGEVK